MESTHLRLPMQVVINDLRLNLIGDPHVSRVFTTGVPLHRRGEREKMVWETFEFQLSQPADMTIIMGDLFDKFVVPPEVVIMAATRLLANSRESQPIYILRGNHDASRDTQKKSSFDLLRLILEAQEFSNIFFIEDAQYVRIDSQVFLLSGWQPFVSAKEAILKIGVNPWGEPVAAAFGHWDLVQHGEDTHNLIPIDELAALNVPHVYNGHIHKAATVISAGIKVTSVGSMQPYAHGEQQPGDRLYLTLSAPEAAEQLLQDPDAFKWSNVRLLIKPGQEANLDFDCLSVTTKLLEADEEDGGEQFVVQYDAFDLKSLLNKSCAGTGVSPTLQARIEAMLLEKMTHV